MNLTKCKIDSLDGFTLAELLVAISILIIVTGLTIPVVKKTLPDSDRMTIKRVYYQLGAIIQSMTSNPYVYPTGRFDNPRNYTNQQNGNTYTKEEKFTKFFISKFNVMETQDLNVNEKWKGSSSDTIVNEALNSILGYSDKDGKIKRDLEDDPKKRTCFLTNDKIYYCVPNITYIDYTVPSVATEGEIKSLKKNHDRFYDEGNIVIQVFLSNNHLIENGYYFTVNKEGKLGLLPTDNITVLLPTSKLSEFKCEDKDGVVPTCADDCLYEHVKQCKLYEYLATTK